MNKVISKIGGVRIRRGFLKQKLQVQDRALVKNMETAINAKPNYALAA